MRSGKNPPKETRMPFFLLPLPIELSTFSVVATLIVLKSFHAANSAILFMPVPINLWALPVVATL